MAHYGFYAVKKVTPIGASINNIAVKKLARIFCAHVPMPENKVPSIIEIGPGQGLFASRLKDAIAMKYIAYEPGKQLFDKMKDLGFSVVNKCVPPLPENDDTFDAMALINVLEHMPGTAVAEELLKEGARVLKKNGMLFIVVPNYLDWGKDFFNLDYTHRVIMTELRLSQLLADTGFQLQSISYHYGCVFSGIGRLPKTLTRMCRALLTVLLPRRFSRKETIQKLGALFAENIICVAVKKAVVPAP
jgi:SAM-dependent methyltransferase